MKHFQSVILAGCVLLCVSCAGLGAAKIPAAPPETAPERQPERPAARPPERPMLPEQILGQGRVRAEQLAAFLLERNASAEAGFAGNLAALYIEECSAEGVNHDVAFSQMCLETGFLRYGGLVTPDMNNFCGLGAIGPEQRGERFPSPRIGVRAHVQHLKGYAAGTPLNRELVDPRYRWIKYGSAPTIYELAGRWASDPEYGNKINAILERLYNHAF